VRILSVVRTILIVILLGLCRSISHADFRAGTGVLVIEHTISLAFEPQEVVFLVERADAIVGAGALERVRGLGVLADITPAEQDPGTSPQKRRWLLGAPFQPQAGVLQVQYSILIAGTANRYEFVPSITMHIADLPPWWASSAQLNIAGLPIDQVRAQLLLTKERIKAEQKKRKVAVNELEKIRMDAEVIGNFAKILELRSERNRLDAEAAASEVYAASLKRSLERAKSPATPSNFPRRELQLTQQIAELVRVTKQLQDRR